MESEIPNIGRYQEELNLTIQVLQKISPLALQFQAQLTGGDIFYKSDKSIVTIYDYCLQAYIIHYIHSLFPDDVIIAEENMAEIPNSNFISKINQICQDINCIELFNLISKEVPPNTERFWDIDPIDGTTGFKRGEHFVIAICLIINNDVILSALSWPTHQTIFTGLPFSGPVIFFSSKNHGAYAYGKESNKNQQFSTFQSVLKIRDQFNKINDSVQSQNNKSNNNNDNNNNDNNNNDNDNNDNDNNDNDNNNNNINHWKSIRIHIPSDEKKISKEVVEPFLFEPFRSKISNILLSISPFHMIYMTSMSKALLVATGHAWAYLRHPLIKKEFNHDIAPVSLIVQEAGGIVTDGNGRQLSFGNDGKVIDGDSGIIFSCRGENIHKLLVKGFKSEFNV